MNPTGHAAVYFSNICAATPTSLRRCNDGERGVVISRYHRIAGYDWIAIPLLPYLYAVDRPSEVPSSTSPEEVAILRNAWRRAQLADMIPDTVDGEPPIGDWTQLIGSAYDRTLYAFELPSSGEQDDEFIQMVNAGTNTRRFSLLFRNCADFARQVIDFYYPGAVHRSFVADVGIMTPKQAAISLVKYAKRNEITIPVYEIPQIAGTVPRSTAVRGVLESLVRSKRYALPLASIAALHPLFGGSLAFAWIERNHFDPRSMTESGSAPSNPAEIATLLNGGE
jgi:hypothetical protein